MPTRRLLLVAVVALSLAAPLLAATPEERTLDLPWRSNYFGHAWVESGTLALRHGFALDQDPLWLAAAQASFVAPPAAAQDGLAVSPSRLEFFLDVAKPGKYYTWYRLRAKQAGEYKHLEGVDSAAGAPIGWVTLDVQGGRYLDLAAPRVPRRVQGRPARAADGLLDARRGPQPRGPGQRREMDPARRGDLPRAGRRCSLDRGLRRHRRDPALHRA